MLFSVLWFLLYLLLALVGTILLLLSLPLRLRVEGRLWDWEPWGAVGIDYGFGLLSFKLRPGETSGLRLLGFHLALPRGDSWSWKARTRRPGRRGPGARWFLDHRHTMLRILGHFWRCFHLRGWLRGMVGTGDPVDALALDQGLRRLAGRGGPAFSLDVGSDFVERRLDLEASLRGRVWLPEFAAMALYLMLQPPTLRMLWRARQAG